MEAPQIPPSEGGTPTSPSSPAPQRRYETRRPPTTLEATTLRPESSVRHPPAKRARTLGPSESFERPMLTAPPIEGNLDCKRYHLEHLMTPREFFYPRVALDFYQSITTRCVSSPTAIHFTIDGRHGILDARGIAEALQIPFEPRDMVHILSRGTSIDSILLRKELPPGMLLIDVGFYFGPHHLIMVSLVHFEEKVHRKKLQRVDTIPLLFPRLLCQILEYMGFLTEPRLERRGLCRERFTLDK
ncbi:hypothetical protein AAG906_035854 [Vitis piasezkii]